MQGSKPRGFDLGDQGLHIPPHMLLCVHYLKQLNLFKKNNVSNDSKKNKQSNAVIMSYGLEKF